MDLKSIEIDSVDVYRLVFEFLRTLWRSEVNLVSNTGSARDGEPFVGTTVVSFSHISVNGTRFGTWSSHRGKGTSYAFIDGRQAVRIRSIFQVHHDHHDITQDPLVTTFIIVVRFKKEGLPRMPWSDQSVSLLHFIYALSSSPRQGN